MLDKWVFQWEKHLFLTLRSKAATGSPRTRHRVRLHESVFTEPVFYGAVRVLRDGHACSFSDFIASVFFFRIVLVSRHVVPTRPPSFCSWSLNRKTGAKLCLEPTRKSTRDDLTMNSSSLLLKYYRPCLVFSNDLWSSELWMFFVSHSRYISVCDCVLGTSVTWKQVSS